MFHSRKWNLQRSKALCAGNPLIREKMEIDIEVHKLQTLKSAYLNQRYKA